MVFPLDLRFSTIDYQPKRSDYEGFEIVPRLYNYSDYQLLATFDYRATIATIATIRLSTMTATIDFRATFRLSGDYRLCDYQRLWRL